MIPNIVMYIYEYINAYILCLKKKEDEYNVVKFIVYSFHCSYIDNI